MSKRKNPGAPGRRDPSRSSTPRQDAQRSRGPAAPGAQGTSSPDTGSPLLTQVAMLVAVFVVATVIAELAGAANLGVAAGVGQVAFALALVALLLRGR